MANPYPLLGLLLVLHVTLFDPARCDSSVVLDAVVDKIHKGPQLVEHKCRRLDRDILRHLASKTPYRVVANFNDSRLTYEGCEALRIFGIVRHGTRTPGVKNAKMIRNTLGKVISYLSSSNIDDSLIDSEDSICQNERDRILNWKLTLENEEGKTLTREGEDEMFNLAKRFHKRFPELLSQAYSNSSYYFKSTETQRAQRSARSFAAGLFGEKPSQDVWYPEPMDKDPILRFYKICKRWKVDVKESTASKRELNLHKESMEAQAMLTRLTNLLRLNYTLSYDDVNLMYLTCAFEVAWHVENNSPWCAVFTKRDVEILEYGEELKYYWRDGYGFPVNYQQACVLTRNVFDDFSSTSEPEKHATFYFTHSGTILKLLSNLGLYKDEFRLTQNLPAHMRRDRKWRTSIIDAFGSNVVFALYRCSGDLKVLTLHQERPVHIDGCPQHDLCPLETIRQVLGADSSCNFTSICSFPHTEL